MEPYIAALLPVAGVPATPPGGHEVLTPQAAAAERVILALRLDRGLAESEAAQPPLSAVRDWAESAGLLERTDIDGESRLRLTTRGRLLSNELFARLI
jgi:oxygen-independent coproporphyrinogen-3 oxidase